MLPIMDGDGASGDPASEYKRGLEPWWHLIEYLLFIGLGVAVLLANWSRADPNINFAQAATDQLNFLLKDVPRTSDGVISQRDTEVQLW
jgi:hypothetical protein